MFKLHAKQEIFERMVEACDEVGFGGARGPGKSWMLNFEVLKYGCRWPGTQSVLARRDLADLKDTTLVETRKVIGMVPGLAGIARIFGERGRPEIHLDLGGGVVSKIYCREAKDINSLMSGNFGMVAVDEAHETSLDFYLAISGAIGRSATASGEMAPGKLIWASNPGPGWCKAQFPVGGEVRRVGEPLVDRDGRARQRVLGFVPALPGDNPHLPVDFEAKLRLKYPAAWVSRYLEGNWNSFEGQVFVEFEPDRHVVGWGSGPEDFPEWLTVLALDWGYTNPAAALLASVDPDGKWHVWRERRAVGRSVEDWIPVLREMEMGVRVTARLMDPAANDQQGRTVAELFGAHGYPMGVWSKRKHGPDGTIMFLKGLMSRDQFRVDPRCAGLIEELAEARWEPQTAAAALKSNPSERMLDKDDHSIDALFGAMEFWRSRGVEVTPELAARREAASRKVALRVDGGENRLDRAGMLRKSEPFRVLRVGRGTQSGWGRMLR